MDLIPAVDILEGAAVRLLRGSYEAVTVYAPDAADMVAHWGAEGAPLVHVVDLDAARGRSRDLPMLRRIAATGVPFQVGGGIRDAQSAEAAIEIGAHRVVLGSTLVSEPEEAAAIAAAVGADRIVAAIDVRSGRAVGAGWLDEGTPVPTAVQRANDLGITVGLVTGIDRDGTMDGPDTELLDLVRTLAPDWSMIASGGVGTIEDVRTLASSRAGIDAVIIGRALYERRFRYAHAASVVRRGS